MDYIEGESSWRAGRTRPQALRVGATPPATASSGTPRSTSILRLAEASGCPMHIVHMQTPRGRIEAVRRAKARGVDVTLRGQPLGAVPVAAGTTSRRSGRTRCRTGCPTRPAPPSGRACATAPSTCIASDHAPHTREEKEIGWTQMWSAHTGTPGIQYYYPLLLDAVNQGSSTLERAVERWPARSRPRSFGLGRTRAGSAPACDADIVDRRPRPRRGRSPTTACCPDRLDAVRRAQAAPRRSTARSCAASMSAPTARCRPARVRDSHCRRPTTSRELT